MSPGDPKREPPGSSQWILDALARHEGSLIAYAARITGDVDRARDVVQETFLRLCRQERGELDGHVTQWLFTVCRNRALDVREKEKPVITHSKTSEAWTRERPSPEPGPDAALEAKEAVGQVFACMDRLPENQREVLRLKFQHGLSYREISGVTELTVGNVGFLIHQGLKTLKELLQVSPPHSARTTEQASGQTALGGTAS